MSEVGKDLIQSANEVINGETRTFVEVVRCKDCKYWQEPVEQDGYKYPSQCTRDERAYMEECAILMDADDFCSRGERKDG